MVTEMYLFHIGDECSDLGIDLFSSRSQQGARQFENGLRRLLDRLPRPRVSPSEGKFIQNIPQIVRVLSDVGLVINTIRKIVTLDSLRFFRAWHNHCLLLGVFGEKVMELMSKGCCSRTLLKEVFPIGGNKGFLDKCRNGILLIVPIFVLGLLSPVVMSDIVQGPVACRNSFAPGFNHVCNNLFDLPLRSRVSGLNGSRSQLFRFRRPGRH